MFGVRYLKCEALVSVILLGVGSCTAPAATADDRALLIATTSYEDPIHNLPGIALDLEEMHRFSRKLGFSEDSIKTLSGADVTLENVRAQFGGFLTDGVQPEDSVFIYYSGHGMQVPDRNGDEDDRRDEAISMYNLAPAVAGWDGILLDDEFSALLRALPSKNVVVVVDACHSGTVTRSFQPVIASTTRAFSDKNLVVKALPFRDNSKVRSGFVKGPGSITDEIPAGVVSLSAAQDDEMSLASHQGSLFTLALAQSLEAQRGDASPASLVQAATAILDSQLDDELRFLPNLSGDERLYNRSLILGAEQAGQSKVNWKDLIAWAGDLPPLDVEIPRFMVTVNTPFDVSVRLPVAGYLNVLAVDSDDQMILLYPNAYEKSNKLAAGDHRLPGHRDFSWTAQPPWGDTMIITLFSEEPINLFASSTQKRIDGSPVADYVLPSLAGLTGFRTRQQGVAGAVSFLKTCETLEAC